MRHCLLALVVSLLGAAEPVLAQPPLPAGKPAGARAAQMETSSAIFIGAAIVLLVGGLAAASFPYRIPGQTSTPSTGH